MGWAALLERRRPAVTLLFQKALVTRPIAALLVRPGHLFPHRPVDPVGLPNEGFVLRRSEVAHRREELRRLGLELRVGDRALDRLDQALADVGRQPPGPDEAAQ